MRFFGISLFMVALDLRARFRTRFFPRGRKIYPVLKRGVETILAVLLLLLLAPLFIIVSLAIRLDTPGSAIFRQTRVGKNGKPFTFYKFRTMYQDIERSGHRAFMAAFVDGRVDALGTPGAVYKPIRASQLTRVGRLLRKTSLDELPQILNVIKGDMSFIGPRPNVVGEAERYKDWHKRRLEVLPGITGLAQVNGRSSIPFDQIVSYDIEYVDNQCLTLDLKILIRTLPAVARGNGAK